MQELENNSLQSSCLKVIVDEFERYFSAFCNSDDAALKRRFEFLQRKYSYQMATFLYEKNQMKAEYVDFFVNKHLKVLDFDWLKDCTWETIVAKFQEVGSGLQRVYFCNNYFEKPLEDLMCYLKNLEVVIFQVCCNDKILQCLAKFCNNVVEIDTVFSQAVTNVGMKYLCTKENGESTGLNLKKLYICNTGVTDKGMAYLLKHMPSIELTNYDDLATVLYSMHIKDLLHIDKITPYNLQKLEISYDVVPSMTNCLKMFTHLCPHLKSLDFTIKKKKHLNLISGFRELEELKVNNFSYSEVEIDELLELIGRRLHSLSISYVTLSVLNLANYCPLLKKLRLYAINFQTVSVNRLVFSYLEKCTFLNTKTIKPVCLILTSSSKLKSLTFKQCNLRSNLIEMAILQCCEQNLLKKVKIADCSINPNLYEDILLNSHSLKELTLEFHDYNGFAISRDDRDSLETRLAGIARSLPNNPAVAIHL